MHESEFENQHKVRWEMNIEIASSFYLKMENYLKFPILGWLLVTFGTHRSSKSSTERRARDFGQDGWDIWPNNEAYAHFCMFAHGCKEGKKEREQKQQQQQCSSPV